MALLFQWVFLTGYHILVALPGTWCEDNAKGQGFCNKIWAMNEICKSLGRCFHHFKPVDVETSLHINNPDLTSEPRLACAVEIRHQIYTDRVILARPRPTLVPVRLAVGPGVAVLAVAVVRTGRFKGSDCTTSTVSLLS